jgi:hypothetical protein
MSFLLLYSDVMGFDFSEFYNCEKSAACFVPPLEWNTEEDDEWVRFIFDIYTSPILHCMYIFKIYSDTPYLLFQYERKSIVPLSLWPEMPLLTRTGCSE